jgi:hypothetical protein
MYDPPHRAEITRTDCLVPVAAATKWFGVWRGSLVRTAERLQCYIGWHGDPPRKGRVARSRSLAAHTAYL